MSSGWNGIEIKSVGRTRRKLAELICKQTGFLIEAHELQRTNPNVQHFEDCCAWDAWMIIPGSNPRKAHVYSWSPMGECAKGFIIETDGHYDYEITAFHGMKDVCQSKCDHEWRERALREETFGVQWGSYRYRICFRCGLEQMADDTRQRTAGDWVTIKDA